MRVTVEQVCSVMYFGMLNNPADTLNIQIAATFQQKRDHFDTTAGLGVGRIAVKSNLASSKVIEWE